MPAKARRKGDGEAFIAAHNKCVRQRNNALALGQKRGRVPAASRPPLPEASQRLHCPHRPAGHFCPYSDGGKGLAAALAPLLQRRRLAKPPAEAPFIPFTGRRWRQPDEGRR
ncbi:hypothetical protein EN802_29565 [bacterium M00.F.Ca.ET.159.01.1.1]|nr:hypothetical protein EN802_29565 [bacterium M00.F.Ca.ET.159.01.1.1]TGT79916.1 hypothetical protein EN800_29230 [bacterium M00.F.Ca.ET.157.01.1.1]